MQNSKVNWTMDKFVKTRNIRKLILQCTYSDKGEFERSVTNLRRLLELAPKHVNGRVALGVALMRQGQAKQAEAELRKAVQDEPANLFAQQNLGGCLLLVGEYREAIPYLKQATELNPSDEKAWFGLGQAHEKLGALEDADAAYRRVLEVNEFGEAADLAKEGRSRIAQASFRTATPGMERMDAVMYCLGALQKFEQMSQEQVRQTGVEIAMLGMNGINVTDPSITYHLRSLPGEFTGLHLMCLEYVAFKQTMPEMDIGFDVAAEYRSAQTLNQSKTDRLV